MRQGNPWLWVEAVCNGCAEGNFGRHIRVKGSSRSLREVAAEAKRCGWTVDGAGEWTCRTCQGDAPTRCGIPAKHQLFGAT